MKKRKLIPYFLLAVMLLIFTVSVIMLIKDFRASRNARKEIAVLAENITSPPGEEEKRNISALVEQNPDCIGWLCIEGTSINYPVMYTPDEPEKYLRRSFMGEKSNHGVPFLDARCAPESGNLIIYGHNMKDGTMFSELSSYLDESFLKQHPVIELETEYENSRWSVKEVRVVREDDEWYTQIDSPDTGRYLTLSTCIGEKDEMRLIVISKKRK